MGRIKTGSTTQSGSSRPKPARHSVPSIFYIAAVQLASDDLGGCSLHLAQPAMCKLSTLLRVAVTFIGLGGSRSQIALHPSDNQQKLGVRFLDGAFACGGRSSGAAYSDRPLWPAICSTNTSCVSHGARETAAAFPNIPRKNAPWRAVVGASQDQSQRLPWVRSV